MIKRLLLAIGMFSASLVWMVVAVLFALPEFILTGKSRASDWVTEKWLNPLVDKIEEAQNEHQRC